MPMLERYTPSTSCQPNEAHHPHLMICSDPDDECWDDLDDGRGYMQYHELTCCVCRQDWPCDTKKAHVAERKRQKIINKSLSQLDILGEQYVHTEWPNAGRTCILAAPFEGSRLEGDGLFMWTTIIWEHGGGLSPDHRCVLPHPS